MKNKKARTENAEKWLKNRPHGIHPPGQGEPSRILKIGTYSRKGNMTT